MCERLEKLLAARLTSATVSAALVPLRGSRAPRSARISPSGAPHASMSLMMSGCLSPPQNADGGGCRLDLGASVPIPSRLRRDSGSHHAPGQDVLVHSHVHVRTYVHVRAASGSDPFPLPRRHFPRPPSGSPGIIDDPHPPHHLRLDGGDPPPFPPPPLAGVRLDASLSSSGSFPVLSRSIRENPAAPVNPLISGFIAHGSSYGGMWEKMSGFMPTRISLRTPSV